MITAETLRRLPKDKLLAALSELTPSQIEELQYTWEFWARPDQLEPEGNWKIWMPLAGRGWGKDAVKTSDILTYNRGWIKLGDIEIGDFVFAWNGSKTKVIDFYDPKPRQLVEFTFSDGEKVTTSVEHDWVTHTKEERKKRKPPSKKTTQEIVDTFTYGSRQDNNHSIPLAKPLEGVKNPVIVDPYYLGFWLGDGISKSCHEICVGEEDRKFYTDLWPEFSHRGRLIYRAPTEAFQWLRDMGVRDNKHIPSVVFSASVAQRLEVLRGLMDSDGYAEKSKVEFTTTNKRLAEGVLELVRGLGQKPVLVEGVATLYGKNCGNKYRITWRPANEVNPFKLPRKANKITFGGKQSARNEHRMITSYRYVEYEPTRCISVDHPDHLFLIGKGLIPTHNTRTGAEWVRKQVKKGLGRIACVAPTRGDVRRVMVEGESGLLNVCWKHDRTYRNANMGYPTWSPTNNTLTWENGAVAQFFSAEDPERLRGPQFHAAWCDEICAWNNMEETWDMLQFTLRLGKKPRVLITTTPKPVKLIRTLLKPENIESGRIYRTSGSSYDNKDNIDLEALSQYEGTRLGRQELHAEILDEAAGALWNRNMIDEAQYDLPEGSVVKAEDGSVDYDASRIAFAQTLARVVVSVDPAVSANEESDMTGIIVAGVDINGTAYIIEDATGQYLPEQWATKVQELFQKYEADLVVAERNQGGDMVKHTIRTVDELLPVKMVHASRGKFARAEPVSSLYERKKVKHLKYLESLEEQMVTWEPLGSIGSPDRLDAMVWAITNLLLKGYAQAPVKISYGALSGISF